jgi:hypothetical protein
MPEVPQHVIDQTVAALRKAEIHMVAFADAEPYKDDPRWSPWDRFQKPVAKCCKAARTALLAVGENER